MITRKDIKEGLATIQIAETINTLAAMLKRAEVPLGANARENEALRHAIYLLKGLLVNPRRRPK